MITIITGLPGSGKTSFLTYLLVQKIMNEGVSDWRQSGREIKRLQSGGFINLEISPQRHLCFSDYNVNFGRFQSYHIDGFEIGLPNPYFNTAFIPPYSTIFLDEAQRYYDSRMSKYLRDDVYRWYQLHRHNDYTVYMACQRIGNIDLNIRAIAERVLVLDSIKVIKNDYGSVSKIKWTMREFLSADSAEEYMLAREKGQISKLGKVLEVSTNLDVFSFYDSKSCKPAFFLGQENRPFDYFTENGYKFTLESFVNYNNVHYFTAPVGFWKNARYDDKILKEKGYMSYGD